MLILKKHVNQLENTLNFNCHIQYCFITFWIYLILNKKTNTCNNKIWMCNIIDWKTWLMVFSQKKYIHVTNAKWNDHFCHGHDYVTMGKFSPMLLAAIWCTQNSSTKATPQITIQKALFHYFQYFNSFNGVVDGKGISNRKYSQHYITSCI